MGEAGRLARALRPQRGAGSDLSQGRAQLPRSADEFDLWPIGQRDDIRVASLALGLGGPGEGGQHARRGALAERR